MFDFILSADLTMPDKNKTNLAKTPLFSRFLSNSRLKYVWYVCHTRYNIQVIQER